MILPLAPSVWVRELISDWDSSSETYVIAMVEVVHKYYWIHTDKIAGVPAMEKWQISLIHIHIVCI